MPRETFKIDLSSTTQKVTITKENIIDKTRYRPTKLCFVVGKVLRGRDFCSFSNFEASP
jgi:hypothetical protein